MKSFLFISMSNKAFSNNFNVRIEITVQCVMCNLVSSDLSANTISFLTFKLEEIRYYDSELDIWYDEKNIITVEKDFYTQNMHFFISQIKNAAAIKEVDQVKIQLFRALKRIALKWYMNELDDDIWLLMRISDEITIWYQKLTKWFHENSFIIMNKIIKKKFILQNACNNHVLVDYMSNIFCHE